MTAEPTLRCRVVESVDRLTPGESATVGLEITNASPVIDAIRVHVEGPEALHWSVEPDLIALFPDDSGSVRIELTPGAGVRAGELDLHMVIVSTSDATTIERIPLSVQVMPVAAIELLAQPTRLTKRAKGSFAITCTNRGNSSLEIDLGAKEASHALRVSCNPPTMTLDPDESSVATINVRAKRKFFGNELAYPIDFISTSPETQTKTQVTFVQRPMIPRGARTLLILGAIVAAWAIIVVLALTHALGTTPLSKVVPASFYASSAAKGKTVAPAGAVPKSGVAIGIGGTLTGTVDATSTKQGVGRLTVQAFSVDGSNVHLVASAATASNGGWSIPGLAPGKYALSVSATGFRTTWYPDTTSFASAKLIDVQSLRTIGNLRLSAQGLPGSITGTVDTGESPSPTVTVTVLPENGGVVSKTAAPLATTTTNSSGGYTLANLPTPGTYDLSFSSSGFTVGQSVDVLSGGAHYSANTVVLVAAQGTITGTVSAAGQPLGGVTVTATGSGTKITTATPTSGPIGSYLLANLPTPGTYAITFSAPGYGSTSVAEQIGPGQSLTNINVSLTGGAGDISGKVVTASGTPIGGATVTASVGSTSITATTATTGSQAGAFLLSHLPTPGTYAITFSAPGYEAKTLDVTLATNATASNIDATLAPSTSTIVGSVNSSTGSGLAGATVTLTDGSTTVTTVSASSPAGSFELPEVSPGTYSITATLNGYLSNTVQVTVVAGKTVTAPTIVLTSSSQAG
ncbi:carboxypeptidase-like regulatory domain-containing protein [Ferrimicrobium acidiphilum]|uniref:carboxypeptidase-like regulatory domain-containing protein n=1 Tax=Ferrimicrobium acidiphilum TaxID=121039 RepID=UPI0023EF8523|nr:carboxypeptidase-like regulatory domain-containing protein [Ferrimicrobium acidiphilum]